MIKKRLYGIEVFRQTCVDGKVVTPGTYLIPKDIVQVNASKLIDANKAVEIEKPVPEPAPEPETEEKESPDVAEVTSREEKAPAVTRRGRPKTSGRKPFGRKSGK